MPNLSLQELDALQNKTDINPGDGTKTEADLEAERQKQVQEAEAAEKLKQQQQGNDQKTPEQLAAEKEANDAAAAAQRLTDLRAKPAEQLTPEEKAELEKATEQEQDDDPIAFWEDVDKLSGDPIEIAWDKYKDKDGNLIQPDSPQGALIRQQAVENRAVERYEQYLMQQDPRGYQYLLHRQAGGADEDFFAQKTTTLPEYEAFKESVDLQTTVYKSSLLAAGIPEKQAKMLVDQAVKDKELFELADKAYKATDAREQKQIKDLQTHLDKERQIYEAGVSALDKMINAEVASPALNIVIPDAKRQAFASFVKSLVTYDEQTRQFAIVQPISKDKLPRMLESLFLLHVDGKLDDVVKRTAATEVTRRLRRAVDKSRETPKTQADTSNRKKTLGEI